MTDPKPDLTRTAAGHEIHDYIDADGRCDQLVGTDYGPCDLPRSAAVHGEPRSPGQEPWAGTETRWWREYRRPVEAWEWDNIEAAIEAEARQQDTLDVERLREALRGFYDAPFAGSEDEWAQAIAAAYRALAAGPQAAGEGERQ